MAKRSLKDFRVLVTGASSGIGRELSLQLASEGARLILLARSEDKLRAVADEIQRAGGRAPVIVVGDITRDEVRREALNFAETQYAGLDCLINNAGIGAFGRFYETNEKQLRQIMEVNFFAAVELTHLAVPLLAEGNSPIVVNLGSILGHRAIPQMSDYCAAKFALRGWSESIRVELAPLGIDVLLVSPGSTETPFYENTIGEQSEPPWSQSTAVPPASVASATIKAMRRGKREIIPSLPGNLLVWASRRFPGIIDRVMRKYA